MAYSMKFFEKRDSKVYVILGDAEMQEGSNWEAMNFAYKYNLDNVVAIVDVNSLGQSDRTSLGWDMEVYKARFESFGFNSVVVDGHNVEAIASALALFQASSGKPCALICKTVKGKGMTTEIEDKQKFHGKPMGDKTDGILAEIKSQIKNNDLKM